MVHVHHILFTNCSSIAGIQTNRYISTWALTLQLVSFFVSGKSYSTDFCHSEHNELWLLCNKQICKNQIHTIDRCFTVGQLHHLRKSFYRFLLSRNNDIMS